MLYALLIIVTGLAIAGVFVLLMSRVVGKQRKAIRDSFAALESEVKDKEELCAKLKESYAQMIELEAIAQVVASYKQLNESLRAEKGRITITATELETVESRLCELEEIERELQASNLETQEELNILKKKEADLKSKNQQLNNQLQTSTTEIDQLLKELEMTTQQREQLEAMKTEIVTTQEKTETVLIQIEEANARYVDLKRRYDALDIEYAQLYEKFSDAEAQIEAKKDQQ